MAKTVRDVMTPRPLTIDAGASIQDAARQMRRWDVREALVTDQGRFRGLLSYRDIVVLAIASDRSPSTTSAGQACDPVTPRLAADQPTAAALDDMRRHDHRHLPVVGDDDRLVGTVWIDDLLATKAATPPPSPPSPPSAPNRPRVLHPPVGLRQRCPSPPTE